MANLLFGQPLNERIQRRLEACGSIRAVASLDPWPGGLKGFEAPIELRCETSWSVPLVDSDTDSRTMDNVGVDAADGTPVYVYTR